MKFFYCCLTMLLVVTNAAIDVEKTVQQVQSILTANSGLPRLTRDEIIQLMNDIKAEDAKTSVSKESIEKTSTPSTDENEINFVSQVNYSHNENINKDKQMFLPTPIPESIERTTKRDEQKITVVLPYTPRDGSSLLELYTRPPRTEIVPVPKVTPKPIKTESSNVNLLNVLNNNAPNKPKHDLSAELQAFLDAHGLTGKPGEDHFLLPLDGFKPLPPARVIDDSIQLPENILLTYDLISPSDLKPGINKKSLSNNNFLYEPLRPEIPFELDTSSSETKETSLPYDMPKSRKTKSTNSAPNLEPIDYDSVKVIPLNKGVNPVDDINSFLASEQNKRQTNSSSEVTSETTTTTTEEAKNSQTSGTDSVSADTDTGPSIADLEDSFGGTAPSQPGDSEIPPPRKNGFYWMVDWNSFLEVGDGDQKVNIRFEPKLGDPQMFLPVTIP